MNQCGGCRVCRWESYNVEQVVLEWTGFGRGIVSGRAAEILQVSSSEFV